MVAYSEATTGKEVYKVQIGGNAEQIGGNADTASPEAGDGHPDFMAESGEVRAVTAGRDFELPAVNQFGDPRLCPPAMSDGTPFVRTRHRL